MYNSLLRFELFTICNRDVYLCGAIAVAWGPSKKHQQLTGREYILGQELVLLLFVPLRFSILFAVTNFTIVHHPSIFASLISSLTLPFYLYIYLFLLSLYISSISTIHNIHNYLDIIARLWCPAVEVDSIFLPGGCTRDTFIIIYTLTRWWCARERDEIPFRIQSHEYNIHIYTQKI